jgi:hypothetical protein
VEHLENRIAPAGVGLQQVLASDSRASDDFGTVAIDQNTAVIGAPGHASSRGAAYVYTRVGSTWTSEAELTAPDGAANDLFGTSVAISGTTVVIGAPGHAVGANSSQGAAYVYVLSGGSFTLVQQELTAPDGASSDQFGTRVALNGNTLVVSAWNRQVGGRTTQGAAYVFTRTGMTWTQQGPDLISGDGATGDNFGSGLAIQGATVVVGADGHGAAYVFGLQGGTWIQQQELTYSLSSFLGESVAIDGNTIVVGASDTMFGGNTSQGIAVIFTLQASSWTVLQDITSQDGGASDNFGSSVAISGSTILVGAPGHFVNGNLGQGSAYVFRNNGADWVQTQEFASQFGEAGDSFGRSVASSGDTVVVGAPGSLGDSSLSQGAAYFSLTGQQEVSTPIVAPNAAFGSSVAIDGATAVIGAKQNSSSPGAAYIFDQNFGFWSERQEISPLDSSAGDAFGASVAISGDTIVVGAPNRTGGGRAYVFFFNGSTWSQQAELLDTGGAGQHFGASVAISGNTILIGDGSYSTMFTTGEGAVYLFTRTGDIWTEQQMLVGSASGAGFGTSVALSSNLLAVVGEPSASPGGFANVYRVFDDSLILQQGLNVGSSVNNFGSSVAIDGNTIAVGASFFGPAIGISGPNPHGEVFVYSYTGSTWTSQPVNNNTFGLDEFIMSLAVKGDTVGVGTTFWAYGYKRNGSMWTQQQQISAGDRVIGSDFFGSSVAVSGDTILVGAPGHQVGTNPGQGVAYFQEATLAYSVADFQRHGVWRYTVISGWQQLTPADASQVAVDDHGSAAAIFLNGLWLYDDANSWQRLTPAAATQIDIAGNEIVVAEFPSNGLWRYGDPVGGGWQRLTPADAQHVAVDDQGDTVASFLGNGVWLYQDASGWRQLTPAGADQVSIAASGSNLVADFPGNGVWRYNLPGPGWQQLTPAVASSLAIGSVFGDVVCEFGNGVWLYEDTTGWQHLSPVLASQVGSALIDQVFVEFPGDGIWKHTSSGWQQVISLDAFLLRGAGG